MVDFLVNNLAIRSLSLNDRTWLPTFFAERWGADLIVAHGVAYIPSQLDGFVAEINADVVGVLTYRIEDDACEVVSLDSLQSGRGIGTALIAAIHTHAQATGRNRLWLITSNDNLNALRFYQKRGFVLVAVHRGAINTARMLKPQIPLIGEDSIPIRDEIELEIILS